MVCTDDYDRYINESVEDDNEDEDDTNYHPVDAETQTDFVPDLVDSDEEQETVEETENNNQILDLLTNPINFENATVGKYKINSKICDNVVSTWYEAFNTETEKHYSCRVYLGVTSFILLGPIFLLDKHEQITEIREIIFEEPHFFVMHDTHFGTLHTHVQTKKRLEESEAKLLFKQIVSVVSHAHDNSIILRNIKLTNFIFADEMHTKLKIDTLDEALILINPNDDLLTHKVGCPAYVSPEIILKPTYHGKPADVWSVGVVLYALLMGRYPFYVHDNITALFDKIKNGSFEFPYNISLEAKHLIQNLLCIDQQNRITIKDVLKHPWLTNSIETSENQLLPDINADLTMSDA
jgi:serine/threonine protein kinase